MEPADTPSNRPGTATDVTLASKSILSKRPRVASPDSCNSDRDPPSDISECHVSECGECNSGQCTLHRAPENMEDDDGFITVIYKKHRKTGIPVILRPVDPEESFVRVNPNLIAKDIMKATQEHIKGHHIAKDGSLVIAVSSLVSAKSLLALTVVANIAVTTRVAESYARNVGKITGVRTAYTNDQLLEFLRPLGVVEARRQRKFRPEEDDTTHTKDGTSVILTFKSDIKMPDTITLGFNTYSVQEYFSPTQCFKCLRFGHIAARCRGQTRCKICAGPHNHKDCTTRRERKCGNCNGPHAATYGGCLRRRAAMEAVRAEAYGEKVSRKSERPLATRRIQKEQEQTKVPAKSVEYFPSLPKRPPKTPREKKQKTPSHVEQRSNAWVSDPSTLQQQQAPHSQTRRRNIPTKSEGSFSEATTLLANFVPLLLAALKAIISSLPGAQRLPEVRDLLAIEPKLQEILSHTQHG